MVNTFQIMQLVANAAALGAFINIIRWQRAQQKINEKQMVTNGNFVLKKIKWKKKIF